MQTWIGSVPDAQDAGRSVHRRRIGARRPTTRALQPSLPSLSELLLLGTLDAQFQPVFDVSEPRRRIRYLEGLVRGPQGSDVTRPDQLFAYARRRRAEVEMDRACVRTVLTAARQTDRAVGVNVRQTTLSSDAGFAPFLASQLEVSALDPGHVVVEILEQGEITDRRVLQQNLRELQAMGVRVAVDDFGTGLANYLLLLYCRPEYLKVAGEFVQGCHADPRRQALLRSIVALGGEIGASVVAEGLEQPEDLAFVRQAGITLLQGYLLGRPARCESWPRAA